ncbi:MAG: hypothetical protein K1X64_00340 [Myxococcaceae bacterium]|nr:hypothetical protein [Myxococcaceae bacterium]
MQTANFVKIVALGGAILGAPVAFASNDVLPDLPSASEKCGCSGASDCTCKKGQCKCPKCGKHNKARMIETLKGQSSDPTLPNTARLDATAGVFI